MKKILVIEDNPEVRDNTAEILEISNYEVITAKNGMIGVELALKEKPDLIVCDIMMPLLDGYGVYHSLRKHPETAAIPFIFLTAKSEKADWRKGMEMGADDYIMKPFDGIDLLNAIEVRLSKHELVRQQFEGAGALDEFLQDVQLTGKIRLTSEEREVFGYNRKQSVYTLGQRPRAVYFIVSGKVKVFRTSEEDKEYITHIYSTGDYFGYASVLEDVNYKEEAEALEETSLMLIPREDFLQLVTSDMQTAQAFIKIITRNVQEQEDGLMHMAYSSMRKKVVHGLLRLLETYKNPVLNLSRENMAQMIGIATESLIRTLSEFKDEKLIDLQQGKVIIADEKKLRNLVY